MQKDPWWVRHRTLGFIVGIFMFFFALVVFGVLNFLVTVWMYFRGFNYDPMRGDYVHRKTGERQS